MTYSCIFSVDKSYKSYLHMYNDLTQIPPIARPGTPQIIGATLPVKKLHMELAHTVGLNGIYRPIYRPIYRLLTSASSASFNPLLLFVSRTIPRSSKVGTLRNLTCILGRSPPVLLVSSISLFHTLFCSSILVNYEAGIY